MYNVHTCSGVVVDGTKLSSSSESSSPEDSLRSFKAINYNQLMR